MKEVLVSIVIPVKNGAYWLKETLTAILAQKIEGKIEVIVIDSGSSDNTPAIVRAFPVQYVSIPAEAYNHGATRNFGANLAIGKYVVMTVQDAKPANDYWLTNLLSGFDDENVAGVCGQQIVAHDKDKNPVEWFRPTGAPTKIKYHFDDANAFNKLSPEAMQNVCGWDNVTACYNREILLSIPFKKVAFAEDAMWAKSALQAGYAIVYNNHAQVYHYHFENPPFVFNRCLTVFYFRYKFFGTIPAQPSMPLHTKLSIIKLLLLQKLPLSEKWKWWQYNINNHNAYLKALNVFKTALQKGEAVLDNTYNFYCSKTPMNTKPIVKVHG